MTAPNFPALAQYASVAPVVLNGALNSALVAGALGTGVLIVGILDPTTLDKKFDPVAEGNPVVSADAAATWLPTLTAISAATVNDQYWAPTFTGTQTGATLVNPNNSLGMVTLQLTPAAKNTVEAPSVMTYKVSPGAIVLYLAAGYSTHTF